MRKKSSVLMFVKKVWHFIWEDNSIWSWILNIILAFVLIKFVVYPLLGLLLGTTHPIVAVVSSSMEHDGNFEEWWQSDAYCGSRLCNQAEFYFNYGITKQDFKKYPFVNGFNAGDIIVLVGVKPEDVKLGDVIVFKSPRPDPIIHRVIKKWEENGVFYFQTKGDHNKMSISTAGLDETRTPEENIIGKAVFRIPYLGWIKIGFVRILSIIKQGF